MRNPNVGGKELQNRQKGYSTATKKLSGDANVRAKESEKKPESSFGVKVGKVTPKTPTQTPYKSTYSFIKEPVDRSKGYGTSMPQKAAASPMKEEASLTSGQLAAKETILKKYGPGEVKFQHGSGYAGLHVIQHKGESGSHAHTYHPETGKLTDPDAKKLASNEEAELSPKQKKIAQISPPEHEIDAGDLAKLRAGHKIEEAKRGRKPKDSGDDEEGPHYDEREDPETGEITRVKDTVPPKKHIMNQLRQAAQSMKKEHPVTYADGSTHNVPKHVEIGRAHV